jgi:hypothetical protein
MTDVRNFRKYIEELSGNNLLIKKIKALEKKQEKLLADMDEIKAAMSLMKKNTSKPAPKPKGRKPRPMIRMIQDEMAKKPDRTMKVTDMVKMLKKKKIKTKAQNFYSSVAASLANSPKFEKVSPGVYRLKELIKEQSKKKPEAVVVEQKPVEEQKPADETTS